MKTLKIENLHVSVEEKEILKGINLEVKEGEIHALMGPNGNGKSTLLAAIMGDPKFTVTEGTITYDGIDVLSLPVNERSKAGIFLGMQYPQEIPGVTNSDFLRAAMNVRRENPVSLFTFIKEIEKSINELQLSEDLAHRFLNEGFSGGEKKRNEIVQMKLLKPTLAMLDEIDSGLDVDAIQIVAKALKDLKEETNMSMILVSHYDRFLELLSPSFTHILVNGKIVVQGGPELYKKIDEEGYDWIYKEYDVEPAAQENNQRTISTLGTCAVRESVKGK